MFCKVSNVNKIAFAVIKFLLLSPSILEEDSPSKKKAKIVRDVDIWSARILHVFWKQDLSNLSPFYKATTYLLCSIFISLMICSFLKWLQ